MIAEAPLQIQQATPQAEAVDACVAQGANSTVVYYSWEFVFPNFITVKQPELTEEEVIQLAQDTGAFTFLDSAEEDIYNDLLEA